MQQLKGPDKIKFDKDVIAVAPTKTWKAQYSYWVANRRSKLIISVPLQLIQWLELNLNSFLQGHVRA